MELPVYLTKKQHEHLLRLDAVSDWEERAAIMEYCGKMSRHLAERTAYAVVVERIQGRQLGLDLSGENRG